MDVSGGFAGIRRGDPVSDSIPRGADETDLSRQAPIAMLREGLLKLRIENSRLRARLHEACASRLPASPPPQAQPEFQAHVAPPASPGASPFLERLRLMRVRMLGGGRLSTRCWRYLARFVQLTEAEGISVAAKRATRKVGRKLGLCKPLVEEPPPAPVAEPPAAIRFRDLPWHYHGNEPRTGAGRTHFQILVGSHSATRTGAPGCLLRLVEEISRLPGVECWVYLQEGGELEADFSRAAPVVRKSDLLAMGIPEGNIPEEIARLFREHSSRGVGVFNTIVMNPLHVGFAAHGVPVLSWIHELPLSIEHFGGRPVIDRIVAASRRIIVPADVVREALIERYGVEPGRVDKVRYGVEARTRDQEHRRQEFRRRVREELGIPDSAPIVLGCGTVELRKGADLFARVCRRTLERATPGEPAAEARFVWVGSPQYAFFQDWLVQDVERGAPPDRLRFIGPRADMVPYFLAADVYALTSREDPCPFVNLEAMESGLPVVAFEDAGGAPEALQDAGACVPYVDVDAMAGEILSILGDNDRSLAMGRRGQEIVRGIYTWPRFMTQFCRILRDDYGYHPEVPLKVSVVVPNYRHARYLEARLRSIFNQTYPPYEIIFLDNASPDDSVAVARRLAEESPVPMKILVNEENNGSPFLQWLKGLEMATGDLVWIAEADDCCRLELLERLVPEFYDPEVMLAYSQSALIGPDDQVLADSFRPHTDDISTSGWLHRYTAEAGEEVERALSQKNTVPNASAAVFRRPAQLDFSDELSRYRFAGDWLFYALRIRSGKIAYLPDVLNLYRRHEQTMTHVAVRSDMYAAETLQVKARIFEMYGPSPNAMAGSLARSMSEYSGLARDYELEHKRLSENPSASLPLERIRSIMGGSSRPRRPRVLFVFSDMSASVENIAAVHLAGALAAEQDVFLCNVRPSTVDAGVREMVDPRVVYLEGSPGSTPWAAAEIDLSATSTFQGHREQLIEELVGFHEIDVIHACGSPAGRLAAALASRRSIPWFGHLEDQRAAVGCTAAGLFFDPAGWPGGPDRPEADGHPTPVALPLGLVPDLLPRPAASWAAAEEGEVFFYAAVDGSSPRPEWHHAIVAAELLNALPPEARGGRSARLVLAADEGTEPIPHAAIGESGAISIRTGLLGRLAAISRCDVLIATADESAAEARLHAVAALAAGVSIIGSETCATAAAIPFEAEGAGQPIALPAAGGHPALALAEAMLRYLKDPGLLSAHGHRARRLFERRYDASHAAAVSSRAYLGSCSSVRPPHAIAGRARQSA